MTTFDASRRQFLKRSVIAGVSVYVANLGSTAFASLFEDKVLAPTDNVWRAGEGMRFRLDGIAKVTGSKVFARDIRARDMPHWPDQQSHAFILRATRCDARFTGIDLSALEDAGLEPDRVVTAQDMARDGIEVPAFYGAPFFLSKGETADYLGYPVAMLIYHDFVRYRLAKNRIRSADEAVVYGEATGYPEKPPYGAFRYIRVGGEDAYAPDVFSALQETVLYPDFRKRHPVWPEALENGKDGERAMHHAQQLADQLDSPDEDVFVFDGEYQTPYIDHFAMEADNTNAWHDPDTHDVHLVCGSQSPADMVKRMTPMLSDSGFESPRFFLHPTYTVGYGSKDNTIFPYYGLIAALYGDGRPVRLANDRFEQFQSTMKRHPFTIRNRLAVERDSGRFRVFKQELTANGGGRANFSNSVAFVGTTAAQGIYYMPSSDLIAKAAYSRMPEAGSMRGYGTIQTMAATELMVDEIAAAIGKDPMALRRANVFKSGMKNTQGAIPAGHLRGDEILERAEKHPIWRERKARKREYEAAHPQHRYGVGFACVQKDFGHGAEGVFSEVRLRPDGRIEIRNTGAEMGTGYSTSQAAVVSAWLGRAADVVQTAQTDWSDLAMFETASPYTISQSEQDEAARDPRWTPQLIQASSASNSAYYLSFPTIEAARVIFRHALWPEAVAYWRRGIGGGQARPYVLREADARWENGKLTANGMEPLSLAFLAERAHAAGRVTGVMAHAFNRWAWSRADFDIDGTSDNLPLDGLAVQYGRGAGPDKKAAMDTARGFHRLERRNVDYPSTQRNNAGVTYYSACGTLVELAVHTGTGEVSLLDHHSFLECGNPIVEELVHGQLEGGLAMGIGHALYEDMPLYEDGPGNGTWNINRYHIPRASEVAVWKQTAEILPALSRTDPPKGIAEVVMIPVAGAIGNAVAHAINHHFHRLPITPERIREVL